MKKQKYYGPFNPSAAVKMLKKSDCLFCTVSDNGTIYAGTAHLFFKMTEEDYNAIIRPVAMCDAAAVRAWFKN